MIRPRDRQVQRLREMVLRVFLVHKQPPAPHCLQAAARAVGVVEGGCLG